MYYKYFSCVIVPVMSSGGHSMYGSLSYVPHSSNAAGVGGHHQQQQPSSLQGGAPPPVSPYNKSVVPGGHPIPSPGKIL